MDFLSLTPFPIHKLKVQVSYTVVRETNTRILIKRKKETGYDKGGRQKNELSFEGIGVCESLLQHAPHRFHLQTC